MEFGKLLMKLLTTVTDEERAEDNAVKSRTRTCADVGPSARSTIKLCGK